eukprot:ANDGO_04970.mRNA.1 hypothetical protein DDB_G0281819
MSEDDAAFRSQFDRSSEDFHNGTPTPVPVGGQRVPETMQAHANWQSMPIVEQTPENWGPEHDRLMKLRNDLGDLKKTISALGIPVEGCAKARQSGAPEDVLMELQAKRDTAIANMVAMKPVFEGTEYSQKCNVIDTIAKEAVEAQDLEQEQYLNYMMRIKQHTTKIFGEQKTLLEQIKAEKKRVQAERA